VKVNSLAEIYVKQGLRVTKKYVSGQKPIAGMPYRNEVLDAVVKALDGAIPEDWIRKNIDPKFTQDQTRHV